VGFGAGINWKSVLYQEFRKVLQCVRATVHRLPGRRATARQVGLHCSSQHGGWVLGAAAAVATRHARRQGAGEVAAELHDWLAAYLWAGGGADALAAASAHWAHGRDAAAFAAALAAAARRGEPGEEDMFAARAVLQARQTYLGPVPRPAAPRSVRAAAVVATGLQQWPAPRVSSGRSVAGRAGAGRAGGARRMGARACPWTLAEAGVGAGCRCCMH